MVEVKEPQFREGIKFRIEVRTNANAEKTYHPQIFMVSNYKWRWFKLRDVWEWRGFEMVKRVSDNSEALWTCNPTKGIGVSTQKEAEELIERYKKEWKASMIKYRSRQILETEHIEL